MSFFIFTFIVILTGGLIFLSLSADLLVRSAGRFAKTLGVSPFIIGATIIAYGTSLPELVVSSLASYENAGALALGNVVGSNLLNSSLVLGVAALICPIFINKKLYGNFFRVEMPFFVGATFLVIAMGFGSSITRIMGGILLFVIAAYLLITLREGAKQRSEYTSSLKKEEKGLKKGDYIVLFLSIIFGLTGLAVSAKIMVDSAITIATLLGVSQRIIGLTIVAFGTSLPELAAAVAAGIKKKSDLVLGNLIGSNLFNLGMILGVSSLVRPLPVEPDGRILDFSFLGINALLVVGFLYFGKGITRTKGIFLLAFYSLFALLLAY